jgi:hypothetical protein
VLSHKSVMSSPMAHLWHTKLAEGKRGEAVIGQYLTQFASVAPVVDTATQLRGIDFWCTREDGSVFTVEVKSCGRGDQTGNAFVETVRNDGDATHEAKPGWVHTCEADWLYYLLTHSGTLYKCRMQAIRDALDGWSVYPIRTVRNTRYTGRGYLVPLDAFALVADQVVTVKG